MWGFPNRRSTSSGKYYFAHAKFRCSDAIRKKRTTKSGSNLNTVGKFEKVKRLCMTEVTSQLGQTFK